MTTVATLTRCPSCRSLVMVIPTRWSGTVTFDSTPTLDGPWYLCTDGFMHRRGGTAIEADEYRYTLHHCSDA